MMSISLLMIGEFVSILGDSGIGKSALMNIIDGMDSEFEGEVLVAKVKTFQIMKESKLDDTF